MKKVYSVLLLLSAFYITHAQLPFDGVRYTDSLTRLLQPSLPDSANARTNFLLSEYWVGKDTTKAWSYLQRGKTLGKKSPYLNAVYEYFAGQYFLRTNKLDQAGTALLRADTLLQKYPISDAYLTRAKSLYNYGVIQQIKDNQKAFTELLTAKIIPLARQAGDSVYVGKCYLAMGIVFKNTGQFDKAEPYCEDAIRLFKKYNSSPEQLVIAYNTIAENYLFLHKIKDARIVLSLSYDLLKAYPESDYFLPYYAADAMCANEEKQYSRALTSINSGIALAQKYGQVFHEQRLQVQKVNVFAQQKNYKGVREILLGLYGQPSWSAYATNRMFIDSALASAYAAEGNMRMAYEWQKKYSNLSDSFYQSQLRNDIAALEIKYQSAEKENKIMALEAEKKQAALKAKNQQLTNLLLGIASAFLLIVTAFLVIYYRNSKKLALQKELSYRQQLKEIEQEQELKLTQAMLKGEEHERQRVARDLHDGLGGMLAGIKIKLSGQSKTGGNLDAVIGQLDQSVTELRRIARNMMPESLLKTGLEAGLADLCESLMNEETQIEFQAFGIQKDIPLATQAHIYRIIQEILSNTIRHADASKIILQCSQNEKIFLITAEDNGKGFDTGTIADAKGIGFSNIKSRVEYLKGKMDIASVINEGTTINIELNIGE